MASPSNSGAMTTTPSSSSTIDPDSVAHAVALGAVVAAPVLMLMPPRKLDLYTFVVAGCGMYGANHLVRERHGVGMMGLAGRRLGYDPSSSSPSSPSTLPSSSSSSSSSSLLSSSFFSSAENHSRPGHESGIERFTLPTERARSLHEALAADRANAERRRSAYGDLRVRAGNLARDGWGTGGDMRRALREARAAVEEDARRHGWDVPLADEEEDEKTVVSARSGKRKRSRSAEVLASATGAEAPSARRRDEDGDGGGGVAGMVRKAWMGNETEGWKERRLAEEQKALDEGKGYSDLIVDQIWEVWNWDKKKNEDGQWVPKDETKTR